jgi:type II secretory pathway pseudopilin PulG
MTLLRPTHPARDQYPRGVMLLGLLISLALGGIGLMAMVDDWALQRQREREQQLLFVGDQYRQAIRRYYYGAPSGQVRQLPANLGAMLNDDRYPSPVHHLRRLYPDPITGSNEWGELRVQDKLVGVYSKSEARPIKQAGFAPAYQSFISQERYQDWVFAFVVPSRATALPVVPTSAPAPKNPQLR